MGAKPSKNKQPQVPQELQDRFDYLVKKYCQFDPNDGDRGDFYQYLYFPEQFELEEYDGWKYRNPSRVYALQGLKDFDKKESREAEFKEILQQIQATGNGEKYQTQVHSLVNSFNEKWKSFVFAWLKCEELLVTEYQNDAEKLHFYIFEAIESTQEFKNEINLKELKDISNATLSKLKSKRNQLTEQKNAADAEKEAEIKKRFEAYEKEYEQVKTELEKRIKAAIQKLKPKYDAYVKEFNSLPNASTAGSIEGTVFKFKSMDVDELGQQNYSHPSDNMFVQDNKDIGRWCGRWSDHVFKEWYELDEKINAVFDKLFEKHYPNGFDEEYAPEGKLEFNLRAFPADLTVSCLGIQEHHISDYIRIPKADVKRYDQNDIRWVKDVAYLIEKSYKEIATIQVESISTDFVLIFPEESIQNHVDFDI